MKFTRESTGTLTVQNVSAAAITVSGETYSRTIAITPDGIIENWDAKPVTELTDTDFEAFLSLAPEIIILGTGNTNVFPPRQLTFALARRGVGLECMDTAAAARTFNVLVTEGRQIAAVFYL